MAGGRKAALPCERRGDPGALMQSHHTTQNCAMRALILPSVAGLGRPETPQRTVYTPASSLTARSRGFEQGPGPDPREYVGSCLLEQRVPYPSRLRRGFAGRAVQVHSALPYAMSIGCRGFAGSAVQVHCMGRRTSRPLSRGFAGRAVQVHSLDVVGLLEACRGFAGRAVQVHLLLLLVNQPLCRGFAGRAVQVHYSLPAPPPSASRGFAGRAVQVHSSCLT